MPRRRVLLVSSEAVPFIKTGGLGDAVGALAESLARRGHDVRVVLPRYYQVDRQGLTRLPAPLGTPLAGGERWSAVLEAGRRARYYFVDHEELFGRDGVYGPTGEESYPDNLLRFAFFCRSALQLIRYLQWKPDVIHLHDWPAALTSLLLRGTDDYPDLAEVPTVLTIHNANYQGLFAPESLDQSGLPEERAPQLGLLAEGSIGLLRAGALYADALTTVSPGYAREVTQPPFGAGLEWIYRFKRIRGILNGADYELWNPQEDRFLPATYSAEDLTGKRAVKEAVLRRRRLELREDRPLLVMISRLTEQKGFDLLTDGRPSLLERLLALPLNMIIMGTGNPRYESSIARLAEAHPNLVGVFAFDEGLSHLLEAAGDFFLMPSKWEPCGLNQIYSLRYGTIPLVTRTGGLGDTVEELSDDYREGTGIVMPGLTAEALMEGVRRAVALYAAGDRAIDAVRRRGMERRFDWDSSAGGYEEIFEELSRRVRRSRR